MTNVRQIDSEVIVEGSKGGGSGGSHIDTQKVELREVVRELVEELLERRLRVEEER
jgi:hypothetical protein